MSQNVCRDCPSTDLAPRGGNNKYKRNQCRECWNKTQRALWEKNREARLVTSRNNYAKHAEKRRQEAAEYKEGHREYYSLCEWFRKKGISIKDIDPSDIQALVDMKKAVKESKEQIK